MEYHGKHYTIVQGIGPHSWKWPVHLDEKISIIYPPPEFPKYTFVHFSGTKSRFSRFGAAQWSREHRVLSRHYLVRQARALLKLAQSTNNPQLSAALVEKAVHLKSQVDESNARPGLSPLAPDVEPETRRAE